MYSSAQSSFGRTCIGAVSGIFARSARRGDTPFVPEFLEVSHDEQMINPTLHPTAWTVADGNWSSGATWVNGTIPTDDDRVLIRHTVTIDDVDAIADSVYVWQAGLLSFAPTVDTRLTVTTIVIDGTGTLHIGTEVDPVDDTVVAELLFRDVALPSQDDDPRQFFNGLLCFGESVIRMYGAEKTTDASSLRLAVEPLAGATTLTMDDPPSGWRIGDKIALPASDPQWWISTDGETTGFPYPYLGETFLIDSITLNVITLSSPLVNDHPGARDRNGVIDFLPHVVNLTRNVRIRSANPDGVRGHCLFGHMADVKLFYASAIELGRTTARMQPGNTTDTFDNSTFDGGGNLTHYGLNQAGRYPWHFHHLYGPENIPDTGYQYEMVGCSVDGGKKWGITLHGTSYGRIEANNLWNCQAAGIGLEGGNEAYNLFTENTSMELVGIPGNTNPPDGIVPTDGSTTTVNNGYWMLEAGENTWTNNVAAGMNGNSVYLGHGFHLDGLRRGGSITGGGNTPERYPLFRGAHVDTGVEGVDYELKTINSTEYADFSGNESYGCLKSYSMDHYGVYPGTITYTDCNSWATAFEAFFIYGADGSASVINPVIRRSVYSAFAPNAMNKTVLRLTGGDIQTDTGVGLEWLGGNFPVDGFPAHELIVEDTLIAAPTPVIIHLSTPAGHGPPDRVLPCKIWTIRNCNLINTDDEDTLITMFPTNPGQAFANDPMTFDQVFIEDFQETPGEDYQLFWNEQSADAIAPGPAITSGYACPVNGLTNQQCFDTYERAFAGELMPDEATTETWLSGGKALGEASTDDGYALWGFIEGKR